MNEWWRMVGEGGHWTDGRVVGTATRYATARELDGHGVMFGWKCFGNLLTVYVEDDGLWHPAMTFDRHWLGDWAWVAEEMWEKA